jgi:hypothetical protein
MKKLLIFVTLLTSLSSYAVSVVPGLVMTNSASGEVELLEAGVYGLITSGAGGVSSLVLSTVGSPIVGLVVLTDNGLASLNLENDDVRDEVLLIQIAFEDGEELSEMQEAILEIGIANAQLDEDAKILE